MSDTLAGVPALEAAIDTDLEAFFANAAAVDTVDNSVATETDETVAEEPDELETEGETPETDEPEAEEGEGAEPEEDDAVPTDGVKILTPEEIEAKFARSNTKEGRAYMAQVSEVARQGQEIVTKLGGEPFIEPLAIMSTALQDPTPENLNQFYVGITEAAGVETLVSILAQAVYMGFTKADDWAANPATADFGGAVQQIVEDAVQHRFGVSSERLQKMAEWEAVGWFDKLDEWVQNNYVPQSDLDEMLEINQNPTLRKLAEENQALKKATKSSADDTTKESVPVEAAFSNFASEKVTTALHELAWAKSPLLDAKTDSAEAKQAKEFFRAALERDAMEEFKKATAGSKLQKDFNLGKASTAVYRTDLTKALNAMIAATKPQTDMAEKILAKLYGTTRNAQLLPKQQVQRKTASVPRAMVAAQAPQAQVIKSIRDIDRELEELIVGSRI